MVDKSELLACGEDVFIDPGAVVKRPQMVSVGSHIAIDLGVLITTAAELGDYIHIGPYTTIIGGAQGILKMGHFSGTAAGCRLICGGDTYDGGGMINPTIPAKYRACAYEPIVFEDFTTIGTGVIVFPGVTLGEGSVVAAGSVVTKSTKPWAIYAGNPARQIRTRRSDIILGYARELGYRD